MRQALGRFPSSPKPIVAAQPARADSKLPMQPALSLTDWTNVPVPSAAEHEVPQLPIRFSTSDYCP